MLKHLLTIVKTQNIFNDDRHDNGHHTLTKRNMETFKEIQKANEHVTHRSAEILKLIQQKTLTHLYRPKGPFYQKGLNINQQFMK